MQRRRHSRGGVLLVIICAIITIALLGATFLYLAQQLGGAREVVNATDSGGLNVAKHSLTTPFVTLTAEEAKYFGGLVPENKVNLGNYNKLFAHALMIAINAQNDDSGDGKAINNANQVTNALQTGPNSIAGRLTREFKKGEGNALLAAFNSTAGANSVRMLKNTNSISGKESEFDVAYVQQGANEEGLTNVEVPEDVKKSFTGQLAAMLGTHNGKTYLRGYVAPALKQGLVRVIGVPVQPGEQPHLISATVFANNRTRCSEISNAELPPNAFMTAGGASGNLAYTYSQVGCLGNEFQVEAAIPEGYIEIVNGSLTGPGSASVPGPYGTRDVWIANEAITGTPVVVGDGHACPPGVRPAIGARTPDLLDNWAKYLHDKSLSPGDPQKKNLSQPSTEGIFQIQVSMTNGIGLASDPKFGTGRFSEGSPVSEAAPFWIEYCMGNSATARIDHLCTDLNVTGDRSTIDGDCANWYQKGVFDRAYGHAGNSFDGKLDPTTDLMAVECAKCQLHSAFPDVPASIHTDTCNVTGIRTFRSRLGTSNIGECKVSDENNVLALADQIAPGFSETIIKEVTLRMKEVSPDVQEIYVKRALGSQNLKLGARMYLTIDKNHELKLSSTKPPGYSSEEPDARVINKERTYDILAQHEDSYGFVNPPRDGGIHDMMYKGGPDSSNLLGHDEVILSLSSGHRNMLGRIQFTNSVSGSASGFTQPD